MSSVSFIVFIRVHAIRLFPSANTVSFELAVDPAHLGEFAKWSYAKAVAIFSCSTVHSLTMTKKIQVGNLRVALYSN